MLICKMCLEKDYVNQAFSFVECKCEKCEQILPCADIPEERLIKKSVHNEIMKETVSKDDLFAERETVEATPADIDKRYVAAVDIHDTQDDVGSTSVYELNNPPVDTTASIIDGETEKPEIKMELKKERKPRTKKEKIESVVAEEVAHNEIVSADTITQELAKHNVTEAVLSEIEQKFPLLTIDGLDDKDGYKAVHEARILCRNTRTMTVDICKLGREEAIKVQKAWIQKEKEVVERIKKVEDELAAKQKAIDDEKERIKEERDKKEQAILQKRAVKLIEFGMSFIGDAYIMDNIKISVTQVKIADDFTWAGLIAAVETAWKRKQEILAEEKRLAEEQATAIKKLAEENLQKQEELRKKEEAIAAREKAIAEAELKAKADAEARVKDEQQAQERKKQEEAASIRKAAEDRLKARTSALFAIGFSQQTDKMVFQTLVIPIAKINEVPDHEWNQWLTVASEQTVKIKAQIEQDRIDREEKIRKDAEDKAKADLAKKAEQERLEKEKLDQENARKAALAPDSQKADDYLHQVGLIPIPEFTSSEYVGYNEIIKKSLGQWIAHIQSKKPKI